ncbi:alpha/beta hydrolase [Alkalicoccus luteus]|uniref:alpha/beta hydrolase n=1 Tax=Alkalicoccus luteus TaxID=1237094 RepID=UPI004034A09C
MQETYQVMKGAEPFKIEGFRVGVLVSHGFTGTTQSMRPLGKAFADAGYTACGVRLKGHGTHYEDMEQSTYEDWIASVEEGYQWLKERCDSIFVVGLSMGGTLALYMAQHHPDISGIVTINAAVDVPDMEQVKHRQERYIDAIGSDIKKPEVVELAYEKTPVASVKQILELMKQVKLDLPRVACPALIMASTEDHVVPPENSNLIYDQISSDQKTFLELKNSYHVATLDNDQQQIIEESLTFMKQHAVFNQE